jgi:3-hydroxyisobutyrate dehydrogenase-like beta-hydroxyacid dehydrogenase
MEIGLVGLGQMGAAMARRILAASHGLRVWNRSEEKAAPLVASGAKAVKTPREAADGDLVISMLANDHAVEEVVLGADGIVAGLRGVHVSSSTISVELARKLTEAHPLGKLVSGCVFGRPAAAEDGKLFVVAAGDPAAVDECGPAFDAIGQRTFYVGPDPYMANLVKIIGNFMIATTIETLGEAFALARKNGVEASKLLEVLSGTLFGAPVVKTYGELIVSGVYDPPGFRLPLGLKDVKLVLAAGEASEVPLPLASLLRDQFLDALAHGGQDVDWAALAEVSARAAGLE